MGFTSTEVDFVLPTGPPLRQPPLSLLDLAPTLVDVPQAVADEAAAQEALLSAQQAEIEAVANDDASEDAAEVIAGLRATIASTSEWINASQKRRADLERWETGFSYVPALAPGSIELFVPGQTGNKAEGDNLPDLAWYDPFLAVDRDERRLLGWLSFDDRKLRARQALIAYEAWQCEHEFWTGTAIPTNYHLTASPTTPVSSPHRTVDAWTDPTAAPGTVLATAVGLKKSLAALDQAIASANAGTGMIHATPYLVQLWSSVYSFLRDAAGNILTVNKNLIVPGYGYPGTGPDGQTAVSSPAADLQWAYATDMVYKMRGPISDYPSSYAQESGMLSSNDAAVRAERPWALISNRLLRAAVLVDTTTV